MSTSNSDRRDSTGKLQFSLSVVIPNFNHSRFLRHNFEALLAQTRQADEVIVIDDASTDDSCKIIEEFLPRFSEAKFLRNEKNLGVVRNMNIGLKMARGTALVFAAADDVLYPAFFERALGLLNFYPDAAFASARTDVIDANGNRHGTLKLSMPRDRPGYIDPGSAARLLMHDDAWFSGNVSVFRHSALTAIGGFPEDLSAFTDAYVSRLLAVTYGVCYIPHTLGAWRRMDDGYSSSVLDDVMGATELTELAARRMRESGAPFIPGYPERWAQRHIFGLRRLALVNARRRAKPLGPWRYAFAIAREIVSTAWLFATLRPHDALPVLLRRLTVRDRAR